MKTRKIRIITNLDRPHITYDILSVLHKYNVGIMSMEVYTYLIYLKLPIVEQDLWDEIISEFQNVKGFEAIEEIDLIAFEERDIEMKRVLDIIPQGVVVLSGQGNIKYANNYVSQRIFKTTADDIANKVITKYIDDKNLDSFLKKQGHQKSMINQEIYIGNQLYTLNINPLLGEENIFVGYILSLSEIIQNNRFHNPISFNDIISEGNKMKEVINQAKLFATSSSPILIAGERGTGKELFARAIHYLSNRNKKPFIAINCAAIPDRLLESELFGYKGGSFVGGNKKDKKGIFEIAESGTVFLDEIGEMAPHLQTKLLRVLQEKTTRRIGSHEEIPIDVRIISATYQNIEEMIKDNQFRLDLLYRINILNLEIPPLREIKEDIPILVEYFIKTHADRYNKIVTGVDPTAMKRLSSYSWPGNVRELQNVIERAVALSTGEKINEKEITLNCNFEKKEKVSENLSLKEVIGDIERNIILESLKNNLSIREASRSLDVTHTLLINRIKRYEIVDEEWK